MTYHGLDIDADGVNKYGGRISHDTNAGKHGIGDQIGTQASMREFVLNDCCKQAYVHWSGTELKREYIPLIIKNNLISLDIKAEVDLFVYFQNDYDDRFNKQKTANEGFLFIWAMFRDQKAD